MHVVPADRTRGGHVAVAATKTALSFTPTACVDTFCGWGLLVPWLKPGVGPITLLDKLRFKKKSFQSLSRETVPVL